MADQFSDRDWFAVVSHAGKQHYAAEQLERQGYSAYLPMCLTERRNREKGRMETIARPLFDRYLFVGIHPEQPFRPVTNTLGVSFVVRGADDIPLRVSPLVLRRVFARCMADGGAVDLRSSRPIQTPRGPMVNWEPGDSLQVINGPFRDFAAVLVEWADKRREMALVMVDLFGRETKIGMPTGDLRPLPRTKGMA